MSDPVFCFPSNPDISGIGVRVAVYAQNLLSFVPAVFALLDKEVTLAELENLETQSTNVLITALALLISTIVQAKGLTNLHAVVILNLSWMNNTNLFIYFLLYVYSRLNDRERTQQDGSGRSGGGPSVWKKEIKKASRNPVFHYGSVHMTFMAAVGIWLWHRPLSFGASRPCSQSASVAVLGHQVLLTSEGLKGWSLFIYSLLLVPGLNLVVPAALFTAPIFLYSRFTPKSSPRRALGLTSITCGLTALAIINVLFLADTEVTLQKNSLEKGDANWTFGQTLALLLLLVPLRDIVETLLERRAKRLGRKLFEASAEGKLDVVQYVHSLGADPKMKDPSLFAAVENGHLNVVKFLLESGANANARNGKTVSEVKNDSQVMERLGGRGTNTNANDQSITGGLLRRAEQGKAIQSEGLTVLMVAVGNGHLDIIEFLLKFSDVNVKDQSGSTALMHAARRGQLDIVKQLIDGQADVNVKGQSGSTALMDAVIRGQLDIVKELIEGHADVNVKDHSGSTALMYAAIRGHLDIVKQLIEGRADVNAKDQSGSTALMYAAIRGQLDIVKQLVEGQADVNAKDQSGSTALMDAALRGHLDIVKQLIEGQADVNAKDQSGFTALELAHGSRHQDIISALKGQLTLVSQNTM